MICTPDTNSVPFMDKKLQARMRLADRCINKQTENKNTDQETKINYQHQSPGIGSKGSYHQTEQILPQKV